MVESKPLQLTQNMQLGSFVHAIHLNATSWANIWAVAKVEPQRLLQR